MPRFHPPFNKKIPFDRLHHVFMSAFHPYDVGAIYRSALERLIHRIPSPPCANKCFSFGQKMPDSYRARSAPENLRHDAAIASAGTSSLHTPRQRPQGRRAALGRGAAGDGGNDEAMKSETWQVASIENQGPARRLKPVQWPSTAEAKTGRRT